MGSNLSGHSQAYLTKNMVSAEDAGGRTSMKKALSERQFRNRVVFVKGSFEKIALRCDPSTGRGH